MSNQRLLRCAIHKGMFSDERVIELTVPERGLVSFLVSAEFIDESSNAVRVLILDKDGRQLAVIPTQRRPAIHVDEGDLLPA